LVIGAACGCGLSDRLNSESRPKPNIAVIILDTLRADGLGCYGSKFPGTSPELDALAERGVRFARAYAQCSWTRPSVAAMLTGFYPRRLGIYFQQYGILGDGPVTLAEALHDHGYATFGITANPHMNSSFNLHQGFDVYVDSIAVYGFMEKDSSQTQYRESRLATAEEIFAQALEFDRQEEEGPKYIQLNLMEVHEWHRGERDLTRPEFDTLYPGRRFNRYYRTVRQISKDVGAFVEDLRARPGWDDALFVLVSDHGEGLGSHPNVPWSRSHGRVLYESQLHVPLVMYRKGWKYAGQVIERPVRLMDLMPTVLDAVGLPVLRGLDGTSLMPLIRDPDASIPLPEYFVMELGMRENDKIAVYGDFWRYYEHADGHKGTAPRELQVTGATEDGRRTSVFRNNRSKALEMARYLNAWAKRHPAAKSIPFKKAVSEEEKAQLRALGYIE
jgi:arylsulfatase A-like enzyme